MEVITMPIDLENQELLLQTFSSAVLKDSENTVLPFLIFLHIFPLYHTPPFLLLCLDLEVKLSWALFYLLYRFSFL